MNHDKISTILKIKMITKFLFLWLTNTSKWWT